MNGNTAVVLLSGLLFACTQPPPPTAVPAPAPVTPPAAAAEPAPANRWVSIRTAKCERLLELPQDDRAAATLFYIGYHAARFQARVINVSAIPTAEAQAYDYCAAHPDRPAVEAFRQAYLRTLR
jgi:hypothetical protein